VGSLDQISGTVYLDANGFIYSVERIEPYHTILQSLWERARNGHCRIITSELTIMETLVKPLRATCRSIDQAVREGGLRGQRPVGAISTARSPNRSASCSKMADSVLENGFRSLLQGSNEVTLIPISVTILEHAAQLRATVAIKTPDAIHAASGLAAGWTHFLTNDGGFRRVASLPIALISELATTTTNAAPAEPAS
jgi:predicted nucleic acid-binding protein